ncbi:uncharacterized protein LOC130700076 [Daphnia carinata]|uniref:uncharacterized protein LOC130700076 n=1 Tax=Daphnia carinata TaxID=120202 RepID=UPI00257AA6D4|nr:uncharacterized protein LOC130700076 [Daphnia carinata]XP_057378069.1 uncharacterized protein LOC130700076 [Daphnia carinata]
MSDISFIRVKEMRLGLFHVRWILKDVLKADSHQQKLQLLGSKSSSTFIIHLNIITKDENIHLGNKKRKFLIGVEEILPRYSVNVITSKEGAAGIHQENLPKLNHQSTDSVVKQLNSWDSRPVYMWIHPHTGSAYANEIPLQNLADRMWSRIVMGSLPNAITLWIDFGTTSLGEKNVIHGLKRLLYSQSQCDVQFVCKNGQEVGAHTLILSTGSPVFAAMFHSKPLIPGVNKVKIDDCEMDVFKQLLVYLYTGNVPNLSDDKTIVMFFKLSDKYGIETLKNQCVELLVKRVTISNAISLLILSRLHAVPKLLESVLEFVAGNGFEVCSQQKWMDLMKHYPDLCLMATRRMTAKNDN